MQIEDVTAIAVETNGLQNGSCLSVGMASGCVMMGRCFSVQHKVYAI
jgi:hypothetical protein